MFRNIFKLKLEKILLGRWERTCDKANTIKVYWANVDHCGTCSKVVVEEKIKVKDIEKDKS